MELNSCLWCSRIGGARATAEALIKKGKEYEREMDVRAALRCYEVICTAVFLMSTAQRSFLNSKKSDLLA